MMDGPYNFKTVGFIGLGAMGKPMLENLVKKLSTESQIYVFDVVEQVVDEVCKQAPDKLHKALSAKNVAEQAVRQS
jgi:3-hydroxyisobutyrate dehydrogenase-like beta-hydroxyacid dehydrogenase